MGLFVTSIGLAIEVHGRFSKAFRQIEDKWLASIQNASRKDQS